MRWTALLAACLPSLCQACGEPVALPGDWRRFTPLCPACAAALTRERGRACVGDGLQLRWALTPEPVIRSLIKGLKYGGRDGALPLLAAALAWRLALEPPPRPWIFLPVPLPWPRRLSRGFNQSELLAVALRERLGEGRVLTLLGRRALAGRQAGRSRRERLQRARGEFRARRAVPATGSLILIDDLATTGATLGACQAALGDAAASRLLALVLTRIPAPGVSLDRLNPP
jgi:predicted amidophosphoribosyltransferase